jgi:hypothetical protein
MSAAGTDAHAKHSQTVQDIGLGLFFPNAKSTI